MCNWAKYHLCGSCEARLGTAHLVLAARLRGLDCLQCIVYISNPVEGSQSRGRAVLMVC